MKRTNYCGDITAELLGTKQTLCGWVNSYRNHGGVLFINSSIVPETSTRTDIKVIEIPANDKAAEVGNSRAANFVMLGAILSTYLPVHFLALALHHPGQLAGILRKG